MPTNKKPNKKSNKKPKKQQPRKPTREKQDKKNNVSVNKTFGPEFKCLLVQMIHWFFDHQQEVEQNLSLKDGERCGSINMEDFELVVLNLDAPCGQDQLHVLTEQLKTSDGAIAYRDVNKQLQRLRLGDDTVTSEDVSADGRMLNPHKERFLRLSVRLLPFHFSAKHPANFDVVLSSSCRVITLIGIIRDRVGIQTSRLEVFRCRESTEESRLLPENSLEGCGFRGGAEETLYYDYTPMFTDCPVLNCDHYLRSTPGPDSVHGCGLNKKSSSSHHGVTKTTQV
ncbi:uncharacterized protein LOC131475228 [Solea solea]|uniref:uncharacterized protein LOC131475228 n=1 Tax=Solea solea TaxID=90069 RepID=UPI002729D0E9|nr:uncharacterized protein LOC131475228 [Solea solea]